MTPLAVAILDRAGQALGGFLPRLGGAVFLLLIGVVLARLLARLLVGALHGIGLDNLAQRGGVDVVLERARLGPSLSRVLGRAVRIALTIVVVFAALSLLGLQFLSESLNKGVLALPKLLIAAALLLAGVVLAGFARERVDRLTDQMDLAVPLGYLAQVTVLAIFVITAAAQIAISTLVLMVLIGVILAGFAATFALAFGLGGRDVARALSAGRYIRADYAIGQDISVRDVRGRITAIDSTSTVLQTDTGETARIPNHLLIDSVVIVFAQRDDDTR
jgi:small-conductance mechanosensitive channel